MSEPGPRVQTIFVRTMSGDEAVFLCELFVEHLEHGPTREEQGMWDSSSVGVRVGGHLLFSLCRRFLCHLLNFAHCLGI